jgi:SAM-dependent methyltransferase
MSQTYSDVDASPDPANAAAWQERMSAWPVVRAYKERTYDLLAGTGRVVDVGCGPGTDVVALGDECVGVDSSATMVEAAARRGVAVCRADAHALPFGSGSLRGARADRVLQHLVDPSRALREMARVVTRGGTLVVVDPDQESLVIQVPGVRRSVLDRLKSLRRDVGYRNGRLISQVPALFDTVGVELLGVDAFVLSISDPADVFGLPTWPHGWRTQGAFTAEELREWDAAMSDVSQTGFVYLLTFLVVAGAKR